MMSVQDYEKLVLKSAVLLARMIDYTDETGDRACISPHYDDEDACAMLAMFKDDVEALNRAKRSQDF